MGKNTNNVDVGFYCSSMKTVNNNDGGWKPCQMRTTTLANLYNNIIPSNWRRVIKSCTKYTDNTGTTNNNASYVTATQENCFLLAEFEIFGYRGMANSAEQNYQQQYAYYANGNSRIRYRHDSPTSLYAAMRLRSTSKNDSRDFCTIDCTSGTGTSVGRGADEKHCFVPVFCIG
jgi:hypothetical protein